MFISISPKITSFPYTTLGNSAPRNNNKQALVECMIIKIVLEWRTLVSMKPNNIFTFLQLCKSYLSLRLLIKIYLFVYHERECDLRLTWCPLVYGIFCPLWLRIKVEKSSRSDISLCVSVFIIVPLISKRHKPVKFCIAEDNKEINMRKKCPCVSPEEKGKL